MVMAALNPTLFMKHKEGWIWLVDPSLKPLKVYLSWGNVNHHIWDLCSHSNNIYHSNRVVVVVLTAVGPSTALMPPIYIPSCLKIYKVLSCNSL